MADIKVGDAVPVSLSGNFSLYFINCQPKSAVSFELQVRMPSAHACG